MNVNVNVNVNARAVYLQVVDPVAASYGAAQPLFAVVQHCQSAMRAAVGQVDLDDLFHGRDKLNSMVRAAIEDASKNWGIEVRISSLCPLSLCDLSDLCWHCPLRAACMVKVKRFEILEILPDDRVRQAMDLQAVAERERREEILRGTAPPPLCKSAPVCRALPCVVLLVSPPLNVRLLCVLWVGVMWCTAEAAKRAMELRSEGKRSQETNESEGNAIARALRSQPLTRFALMGRAQVQRRVS